MTSNDERLIIATGDWQVPFEDERAMWVLLNYIEDTRPDRVVLLGDILDFPGLTTKFTRRAADRGRVEQDIQQAREYILEIARRVTALTFIEGNHEARYRQYIAECAPELDSMTDGPLSLARLLSVPGMEYIGPYPEAVLMGRLVLKHGEAVGRYAAARELEMEGSSGVSGHIHRFQSYYRTDRSGAHAWYCTGCLCNIDGPNLPPGEHRGVRDQQQGWSTIYLDDDDRFAVYQTVVISGTAIAPDGRRYRWLRAREYEQEGP